MSILTNLVRAFVVAHRVYQSPEVEGELEPNELARKLRGVGLPVQAYTLFETIRLEELPYPFLALTPAGWRLYLPPGSSLYVPGEGFWLEGGPVTPETILVAQPPLGRSFRPLREYENTKPDGGEGPDIFLFYAAPTDSEGLAKEQLFPELEAQLARARKAGREVVFLDAVGLIPEKTVKGYGGEKDEQLAFQKALEAIRRETEGLEKGIPMYDGTSPLWAALYRFLAQHRVHSVIEDLEYDLWKRIVEFDAHGLEIQALQELLTGYPEAAARTMLEYIRKFRELNCLERDKRFAQQIERMFQLETGKGPLLWVVREISHYGLLEGLLIRRSLRLQVKILGSVHGRLLDLLKTPPLEELLFNLGVELSNHEQELLSLRRALKMLLLPSIPAQGKDWRGRIEFFSKAHIDDLDLEEIRELFEELHDPLWVRLGHPIDKRLYYLLKDKGVIPDDGPELDE